MQKKGNITGANVVVTGGAGFVGSHVVEKLLEAGSGEVTVLDNLVRGKESNLKQCIDDPRLTFIKGDIRDRHLLDRLFSDADYCIHLAALRINACAADQREGFEVMAKGTFEVIDSATQNNLRKLVYASSASIYGEAQHFPTPESDHPYDNNTFYGAAKLFGEQLLRSYKFMHELDYVALRFFNIYGPKMDREGKYTEVMIKWLHCIAQGQQPVIYGDGSDSMDFVYVTDVAGAVFAALESGKSDETYNIGSGIETNLKELIATLLKVNESSLEVAYKKKTGPNPVRRRVADISKAQNELKYEPKVGLQEGLKKLSEWFFQQKEGEI